MPSFENQALITGTDNKKKKIQPDLERKMAHDLGTEVVVGKAILKYIKNEKEIQGLVYKRIHSNDPEWAKEQQRSVLEKWAYLKKIRQELKKKGGSGFELPSTVRGFQQGSEIGYLITDLSEGGKKKTQDLTELMYFGDITLEEWEIVKKSVLQDVDIAFQSGVLLDNGPENLDPWLITFTENGPKVYLSDIGGYTRIIPVTDETLPIREKGAEKIRIALEKLEANIKERLQNNESLS